MALLERLLQRRSLRAFVYADRLWKTFRIIWLTTYFEEAEVALRKMTVALVKLNQKTARFENHLHSSSNG
jgi:hypothetical protein